MDTYTTTTTTATAGNALHSAQTYTTMATATDTASTITISDGTVASGTYTTRGNTVSSVGRNIFSGFEPYAVIHTNNSNEEIIAILKDICCLLADLYEKKRLGRDGDLGAIRAFLDSIKIETEGERDAESSRH